MHSYREESPCTSIPNRDTSPFVFRPTILLLYTSSPARMNYGYTTFAQPWNVSIKGSPFHA